MEQLQISTDKSALEELLGDVYNDPQPSHPVDPPQQQVDYEVKCFKSESTVSLKSNPLLWWKTKEGLYPHLFFCMYFNILSVLVKAN